MKKINSFEDRVDIDNCGFTLVEVIVVVAILTVLFSMLIPSFSQYLTKNADERDQEMAQNIFDHAQVAFYERYANNDISDKKDCVMNAYKITDKDRNDCDIHDKDFAKQLLKTIGGIDKKKLGNVVLVALGRCDIYADPLSELYDPIKAYTVYMVAYQPYENNRIIFLTSDGMVYHSNPRIDEKKTINIKYNGIEKDKISDTLEVDGETIYIQYYGIKNKLNNNTTLDKMWNIINKTYN